MLDKILYKSTQIFLAEDDDDDAFFVRSALKELDAETELKHFYNGRDLLDTLRQSPGEQPNLILLDLNMPVLDGRETLKIIRAQISADLPIVILSTSSHPVERNACLENGANSYFTKPYSYQKYLEIMRSLKSTWVDKVQA